MDKLTVIEHNGKFVVDSRDVAEMVDKNHKELLRDIRNYVDILTSANLRSLDFFIPHNYKDGKGETRPCFLITRKGCDMVANKMTGEKGVLFTAAYVTRFEEMERRLKQPQTQIQVLQQAINLLAEQEERLRAVEGKQEIINHRIDNLDMTNITGTPRQRLVSMVRKYACQNGITYKQGWGDFVSAFNTAYRTNLNWRVSYAEEQSGKKITTPEFLENVGQIEDAVRVADKMLN